jgi:hypothetical protein
VGSLYTAPSNRVQSQLLEQIILGGDFNAKNPAFVCTTSTPRGITLLQVITRPSGKYF